MKNYLLYTMAINNELAFDGTLSNAINDISLLQEMY